MMSVLQNAFANSSSSLIQSKVTGSIIFVLLPPLSYVEFFLAYLVASMRGLLVGIVLVVTAWFAPLTLRRRCGFWYPSCFAAASWGNAGHDRRDLAEKFDQLAVFQNFLDHAADDVSGVFYSIHSLPPFWLPHFNPVFYMIDGFRYGFSASPTCRR